MKPLPYALKEISGVTWDGSNLWAHNDSGDSPRLFRFTSQGEFLNELEFEGADARDWEDVTNDGKYLFAADCGNNRGNRRDLTVYRTPIPATDSDEVSAVPIRFKFKEQTNFSRKGYTHNFDCEALAATEKSLWVFSKNWGDQQSRVYKLSKQPGDYEIEAIQTLPVWGQITAAEWNKESGRIALLGYRGGLDFNPFVWIANMDENGVDWDSAKQYKPVSDGQWEAITWIDAKTLLLARESSDVSDRKWRLWKPDFK